MNRTTAHPLSLRAWFQLAAREPFRLFFPSAVAAGIAGVSLWPLHLTGFTALYPGQLHARLMTHGMFGGFILGFLGTAMPRLLEAPALRAAETFPLLVLHLAMIVMHATGHPAAGDGLFLLLDLSFLLIAGIRLCRRKSAPPPGFVLVLLALLCAATGASLSLLGDTEKFPSLMTLQRLLTYQGFVLFPILGVGPFLLPRFLGATSSHEFPETPGHATRWRQKAVIAAGAGGMLLGTFLLEAQGLVRVAYGARFCLTAGYLMLELRGLGHSRKTTVFGAVVQAAVAGMWGGFLAVACFPAYRIALLHITLAGGFALITFTVATRVLFGHAGKINLLAGRNAWFLAAMGLMLFGMLTRVSGDFWPKIMTSHYTYGALLWMAGALVWAAFALPQIVAQDPEE
ncbi:MAG TPA: NnrS family protein [Verrucomicrobiae bacterium]|nr:NnrS family protein [Verrucomicrobiae bacterium]